MNSPLDMMRYVALTSVVGGTAGAGSCWSAPGAMLAA